MNWYKKAQLNTDSYKKNKMTYLDIAHDEDVYDNYILWVSYQGSIYTARESYDAPSHEEAFDIHPDAWGRVYKGRYDADTGKLSILAPIMGVSSYRDTPSRLISQLYRAFPNIKNIYKF